MPYLDEYAFYHFWLFCDSHFWLSLKDAISGIFVYAIFGGVCALPQPLNTLLAISIQVVLRLRDTVSRTNFNYRENVHNNGKWRPFP